MSLFNTEKSNKTIFVSLIVIPNIILIGIIVYVFFIVPNKTIKDEDIIIPHRGEGLLITTNNRDIVINNIYRLAGPDLPQKGTRFAETKNYKMSYYPIDQSFSINLLNPNLNFARQKAEEDLIKYLGIKKEEVCALKIVVNVESNISEQYSAQNLGISYCPNSKIIQ